MTAQNIISVLAIEFLSGDCHTLTARVPMPNLDEFLFLPVYAGLWQQHELWDGTYTLDDLLDAVEMITVKRAREREAQAFTF